MSESVTQVRFAREAEGFSSVQTWQFTQAAMVEPEEGEISVRMHDFSVDPAMIGWMADSMGI